MPAILIYTAQKTDRQKFNSIGIFTAKLIQTQKLWESKAQTKYAFLIFKKCFFFVLNNVYVKKV